MHDAKRTTERRSSLRRRSFWLILGLVVIAGAVVGVRDMTGNNAPAASGQVAPTAIPVTAATATRKDFSDVIDAIGDVQPIDAVSVLPRVSGTIEKIEFTPGQNVKQGQELFLIDPRPYQAALDQAKGQLAHDQGVLAEAQMDYKRYQRLVVQNSIAQQTEQDQFYVVQQDQGTVELDEANVEAAQLNLQYCHITAPISGRAGTLLVDLGNLVGPSSVTGASTSSSSSSSGAASSSALVTITQLQPIFVSFTIPQTEVNEVIQNQAKGPLGVGAYSQSGKLLENGKLSVINNQVSTATGTLTLQATFENPDDVLWPGEYVSVQLAVGTLSNVVTVPSSAIMVGPNGYYVYVIGADNKVTHVDVEEEARRGGVSVISKGISAGEAVVATGQARLTSGSVVNIEKPAPQQQEQEQTAGDLGPG